MSELTTDQLDEIIAAFQQLEADLAATLEQLRAAGFSENDSAPVTET